MVEGLDPDQYRGKGVLEDRYNCLICLGVVWKPQECSSCSQIYCQGCIHKGMRCANRCGSSEFQPLNRFLMAELNEKVFSCTYVECPQVIKYQDYSNHCFNCKFKDDKKVCLKEFCAQEKLMWRNKLRDYKNKIANEENKTIQHLRNENNANRQNIEQLKITIADLQEKNRKLEEAFKEGARQIPQSIKEYKMPDCYCLVGLDISIKKEFIGTMVFALFKHTPKASENFRALCTGEKGMSKTEPGSLFSKGKMLSLKDSSFHKVQQYAHVLGGDFIKGTGESGESIYGEPFSESNYKNAHDTRGIISMINKGANTYTSQFMIIFSPQPHLNGRNLTFGQLIEGFDVLNAIEEFGTTNLVNKGDIKIIDSRQIPNK